MEGALRVWIVCVVERCDVHTEARVLRARIEGDGAPLVELELVRVLCACVPSELARGLTVARRRDKFTTS